MTQSWRSWGWQLGIISFLASGAITSGDCAKAQITPDNTLGAESSTVKPLDPQLPVDVIGGGATRGANLFHSFREFNVSEGRGAYFRSPTGVENILSRVTGANASKIFGTLGVLGNANLFLINPNGIIFGPNARLDIRGSFVGSTASSLNFADGTKFQATDHQTTPLLTISVPIGLQFGSNPGNILVQGDGQGARTTTVPIDTDTGLRVPSDQTLVLVGGNVFLQGATLKTAGGQIELGSVAGPGLVSLASAKKGWNLSYEGVQNFQDIQLSQQATVDASGTGGGNVELSGRRITLTDGSQIEASTLGSEPGGTLAVNASESVELNGGSQFSTGLFAQVYSGATGSGGNLTIDTGKLIVRDGAYALTSTFSSGNAGTLRVRAADAVELTGTDANGISSGLYTTTVNTGSAGNLSIDTGKLLVQDKARLLVGAVSSGTGQGGNLTVTAADVSLTNGAFVNASAGGGGSIAINTQNLNVLGGSLLAAGINSGLGSVGGQAGEIKLNATGAITVAGGNSSISNTVGYGAVGKGGDIDILAGSLALTDGAQITTGTFGNGDAGNISIQANGSVSFTDGLMATTVSEEAVGKGGDINILARSLSLTGNSEQILTGINTSTYGQGNAGNVFLQVSDAVSLANSQVYSGVYTSAVGKGGDINILAGSLSLTNNSTLGASTFGQGDAGNVFIQTNGAVSLVNDSLIASSVGSSGTGNGGEMHIQAGSLSLTGDSSLIGSSLGQGKAGNISLQINDAVSLVNSGIFSFGSTVGKGSDITIQAGALSLTDNSNLNTSTYGQGNAGNVFIQTNGSVSLANSNIFSRVESTAVGNGGDINIQAESLSLSDNAELSTETYGQGNAGSVRISASGPVSLTSGSSILSDVASNTLNDEIETQAVGRGGNIDIQAGSLSFDNASLVTLTSGQGDAGNVFINSNGPVLLNSGSFIVSNVVNPGFIGKVGPEAVGNGGNIKILAQSLFLDAEAVLATGTAGRGNSGAIFVHTNDAVSLTRNSRISSAVQEGGVGDGGDIDVQTRSLFLQNGSRIASGVIEGDSLPGGQGNAGDITVDTDTVNLSGVATDGYSAGLFTNTGRGTSGQAGDITVNTNAFHIADGAVVSARTFNASDGGIITINANTFEATGGGQVLTTSRSSGNAGNINLNVRDRVTISGSDPTFSERIAQFGSDVVVNERPASGLFANTATGSTGNGGSISIDPIQLNITDGAGVAVNSQGQGNAGTLSVQAGSLTLERGAFLSAATSSGEGGNINLQVQNLLLMRHNSNITAEAGGTGNGGNIDLNTKFLVAVPSENSDIIANAFKGSGGRVQIAAQGIFGIQFREKQTSQSDITASSTYGANGVVDINTPDVNPSSGLVNLPVQPANPEVVQSCQAGGGKEKSEFVVTGRGGLPPSPSDALSSDAVQVDWVALNSRGENSSSPEAAHHTSSTPASLVEAQGWVIGPKGEVILTASAPSAMPHASWQKLASCQAAKYRP